MSSAVSWDTETRGLSWWDPEEQAFLITWADANGEYWTEADDEEGVERFKQAVMDADVLIAHNAKYDIHQVRETIGFDMSALGKPIEDTELMSRVLYPEGQNKGARGGHSLKNLATLYLSVTAADPEDAIKERAKSLGMRTIKQTGAYHRVYQAFPEEMREYALADARYTYDLWAKWNERAASDAVYQIERELQPIITKAERIGIQTDQAQVQSFKIQFDKQAIALYDSLTGELGEAALLARSEWDDDEENADLAEALQKVGVPLHERTRTGKISTNKFALQEFEAQYPIIADLFEYRRMKRFLNTFISAVDGVEVVHPNFGQIGAWTGRMSSRSPNMQNWPKRAGKEVRGVFVPRPGMAFCVCDYESIEIRFLAYYLGDPTFRQMIADGHDAHAWMAAHIWHGEPADYAKGTAGEKRRSLAKNVLFAITYGAGRKRIAAMLRDAGEPCSLDDAGRIISMVKNTLPNYWHLTKHRIEPKIKEVGYVNTIVGRRNPVNRDKAYVGLNALIQGSAADIFKLGVIAVDKAVTPLGGYCLLFVHDEIVVEVPEENAEECLSRMQTAMCGAWDLNPPLSVEGSYTTRSYADA